MDVDLLAVGPHPDDVEMTCAGLLVKMKRKGYRTGILHLTRGEMGSRGTPEEREKEAARAAEILDADALEFLGLQDGRVRLGEEAVNQVAGALRRFRPKLVVAPFPHDPHPDHGHAGRIVTEAVHMAELAKFGGAGEPHHVNQLVYGMFRVAFRPSFLVDVSAEFETKKEAVLAYHSQVGPRREGEPAFRLASPEFLRGWEARHAHLGTFIGRRFAEAYCCEYLLELEDPVAAFPVPQHYRIADNPLIR